ncbi:DUF3823 domain-containing protein [Siphonobacter sp. SORGH_AS_1065]|uniref:DUF3823 domain-containing protein n=1 Tax=Siphonobacter sp. SORGH_AS_1065 TaxID=3041795 RepID=UPI0027874822|nr:DUF3823 domain-containing protein [Siphonobacter sp. SORGH_AS_1065]MDQ1089800.1 hypothetical protein [Siphonobacter sp. SORGH_AS_1065]
MTISSLFYRLFLFLSVSLLMGCSTEIDNWDYPTSRVSGQFLYKGQPMQLMSTASDAYGSNMLQLHQTGEGWIQGFIKVFAKEDGSYTVNAFDGDYFLNLTPGRGPWVPNTDTLRFSLKGEEKNINFEVTPYFWLSNYTSSYKDSVFTATFNVEQVVSTAAIEKAVIHLCTTAIVDNTSKSFERSFSNVVPGTNTITLDLKTLSTYEKTNLKKTGFLYARVGVKTKNVWDLIYSPTVRLTP